MGISHQPTMGCIHSYEVVFRHPDFVVGDFRCAGVSSGPAADEFTPRHEIAFVRRGIFEKTRGPDVVPADATRVVFFPAGQEYRVRHPLAGGDECTVLQVSDELLREVLRECQPRLADRRQDPFPGSSCAADSAIHLEHWRLFQGLRRGVIDSIEAYERALSLLRRVLAAGVDQAGLHTPRGRASTEREHRELSGAVIEILNREFHRALSLSRIAARVCSSPYHLCRVFKAQTGLPIHRYLSRLRLRAVLDRMARGERDLTRLGLDHGFCSGGHFGCAFRREYGTTPSAVRDALGN